MKLTRKILLLPLLAASSIAVNAATTQSFSDTFSFTGSGTASVSLSQFNSSLGTLQSVD
jgi:hypothetical protein